MVRIPSLTSSTSPLSLRVTSAGSTSATSSAFNPKSRDPSAFHLNATGFDRLISSRPPENGCTSALLFKDDKDEEQGDSMYPPVAGGRASTRAQTRIGEGKARNRSEITMFPVNMPWANPGMLKVSTKPPPPFTMELPAPSTSLPGIIVV